MIRAKKIKDIYSYFTEQDPTAAMLPTSTGFAWWAEYEANHALLDRMFMNRFASFVYLPKDGATDDLELYGKWIIDIFSLFITNKKKYEELYRIHTITDTDLPITYNYDMTEKMDKDTTGQSAMKNGQRTDINDYTQGSQTTEDVNKVTGWNSNDENTNTSLKTGTGSRNDITQFTQGAQESTSNSQGTEDYTLTRKGNIGVMTSSDIAKKFMDFVNDDLFLFYNTIFDDIARTYLQIDGRCDTW